MMRQPSRRSMLLMSQFSILFIALVTTFIPQYYIYVFIIYFLITMAIMFRSSRSMMKIPPQRELGSPIFKERNAIKIAMFDTTLTEELKKQALVSLSLLVMSLLVFIIFPFYYSTILPVSLEYFQAMFGDELIARFIAFLLMYEFVFGILTVLRLLVMRRIRASNIMLPQNFIVYRRGVVLNDRFFIEFSSRYCFEYDPERKFVEIREVSGGSMRIRLYTESLSELRDKIAGLGLNKCSETVV